MDKLQEHRLNVRLMILLSIVTLLACATVIVQYRQGRVQRDELLRVNETNTRILNEIKSCTSVEGACFQQQAHNRALLYEYIRIICERQTDIIKAHGGTLADECRTPDLPREP